MISVFNTIERENVVEKGNADPVGLECPHSPLSALQFVCCPIELEVWIYLQSAAFKEWPMDEDVGYVIANKTVKFFKIFQPIE